MIKFGFLTKEEAIPKLFTKGQIFFITKREANGHLFHEKGGQKALQRLIAQLYLR